MRRLWRRQTPRGAALRAAPGAACLLALLLLSACDRDSESDGAPAPSAASSQSSPAASSGGARPQPAPSASASSAPVDSASAQPVQAAPPPDRWGDKKRWKGSIEEQNAELFEQLSFQEQLSASQRKQVEAIFAASNRLGQGNPDISRHPVSPQACREKLSKAEVDYRSPAFERVCGSPYMAPLYDPETQSADGATTCIDQFEFPNMPCAYPVTWARANEAAAICEAVGKRLCDAHEWEGACAGALTTTDESYNFSLGARLKKNDAIKAMRAQQNNKNHKTRRWAYGPKYRKGVCATSSNKSKNCGVGWRNCGSNTFPAGYFPGCVSSFGVYDQHGNAAEHMNLPLVASQLASSPERTYGHTEMKGSWFVFDIIYAHKDHCRWRAPYWHGTRVANKKSHRNYHLGFRCCKSVSER